MSLTSRRRRANHRARIARICDEQFSSGRLAFAGQSATIGTALPLTITMTDTINIRTNMRCIGGAVEES